MGRSRFFALLGVVFLLLAGPVETQSAVSNLDLNPVGGDDGAFDKGTGLPPPPELLAPATPRAPVARPEPVAGPGWRLSEIGLGPFSIGQKVDVIAAGLKAHASAPGSDCRYASAGDAPGQVDLMLIEGVLARVDVGPERVGEGGPSQVLPNGLSLGSPVADIVAAYGEAVETAPNKYGVGTDYIVTLSASRGMVFETEEGHVSHFRLGRAEEVRWVEGCS